MRKPNRFSSTSARLLEDDDLQPVAHARDVRGRAVEREGLLADDEHVVAAQVRVASTAWHCTPRSFSSAGRLALRVEEGDPRRLLDRPGRGQHVDWKVSVLRLAGAELDRGVELVRARLQVRRQRERQRDALLLARLDGDDRAAALRLRQAERPRAVAVTSRASC